jgi:hypothetical protein
VGAFALTRSDLEAELAVRPGSPEPSALPADTVRRALVELAFEAAAARRTGELGLADTAADEIAWGRLQVLATEQMRRRVAAAMPPLSDAEVRAYFEAHRDRFVRPPRFRLQAIRMPVGAGDPRPRHRQATELAAALQAGRLDFGEAARAHSDLPSAAHGGEAGWVSGPRLFGLGAHLSRAVRRLEVGETSGVVAEDGQLWIVRLLATEPRRPLSFEEAAHQAENLLGNERVQQIEADLETELRSDLGVAWIAGG